MIMKISIKAKLQQFLRCYSGQGLQVAENTDSKEDTDAV